MIRATSSPASGFPRTGRRSPTASGRPGIAAGWPGLRPVPPAGPGSQPLPRRWRRFPRRPRHQPAAAPGSPFEKNCVNIHPWHMIKIASPKATRALKTYLTAFGTLGHRLFFSMIYKNPKNIAAICDINDGEKSDNVEAIGYKGIGFKTVFLDNDYVYLSTGNYSFRFDKSATDIINTPWQILPVWTEPNRADQTVRHIFSHHANDVFRVKFALKPRDSRILTNRERKDNYIDLFSSVFETERVILFIPNIRKVSVFIGDTATPTIVREKNNDATIKDVTPTPGTTDDEKVFNSIVGLKSSWK